MGLKLVKEIIPADHSSSNSSTKTNKGTSLTPVRFRFTEPSTESLRFNLHGSNTRKRTKQKDGVFFHRSRILHTLDRNDERLKVFEKDDVF